MFSKLLGKKRKNESEEKLKIQEIEKKVSFMNLSDMRTYTRGKVENLELCEDGLIAILKRLVKPDTQTGKFYIQSDDMESKKKKSFDLIILIATSKKINLKLVDLVQEFLEVYKEIIVAYDTEHKEIYESRFKDALVIALQTIQHLSDMQNKQDVLGND